MLSSLPTFQTPVNSAPTRLSESFRNVAPESFDADGEPSPDTSTPLPGPAIAPVELASLTPAPADAIPRPPVAAPAPLAPPVAPIAEAPKIVSGPSSILAADPALAPLEQSMPALPAPVAPPVAAAAVPAAAATPFSFDDLIGAPASSRAPKKRKSRWLVRLLLLGGLGAAGYFGVTRGPALYEQYVEGADAAPAELDAPLAFPNVATTAAPIRTAEFTLTGLPETPDATYRVTTDFETAVSQVDITRDNGPDVQVLTFGDDAMIRRVGSEQWYILERGQFPLDGRLNRADWVRRLDELLPPPARTQVVIDKATQSTISSVPTRHLTLTLDAGLLLGSVPTPDQPFDTNADAAPAPAPVDPQPAAPPAVPVVPPPATGPIQIEVWVDADGLVRQVSGAPQLGAETITVVRTTPEAWIPQYPTPEQIATLTASALVDLGL